jgi:hypothetical protein
MRTTQQGAATVGITLMLAFAILLSVAFANRSMLFEVKASANQYRAAQAREAAEAGMDWALAQLNNHAPIGDDCLASSNPTATPWRTRPIADMQAVCRAGDNGWACRCAASGEAGSDGEAIGFTVGFTAAGTPAHALRLTSTGTSNGSRSQVHTLLDRLPGLDTLPAAALTTRGAVSAAFGIHHTHAASGGLTVHSGGAIDTARLHLASTPGTPVMASVAAGDTALAGLTPQGLFASVFRMDKAAWRTQPVVHEIDCSEACDGALAQAAPTHPLIWLRGGLRLSTPLLLGTHERPVLLVVDGPVHVEAHAVIHGVVYGTHAAWTDTARMQIHGAVILEADLQGSGQTQIHHDAAVLQALHERTGTYARLPSSWRDF